MGIKGTTSKLKRVLAGHDDQASKRNKIQVQESLPKKISERHLTIERNNMLGEGAYGSVYRGNYCGEQVAVKRVENEPKTDAYFTSHEIAIMTELSALGAPNVIRLYAYTSTVLPYYLVMPLMQNGSLEWHIENPDAEPLSASLRYKILVGVAKALAFMHHYLLIHCDVKVENVLLDQNFEPFLADFDASVKLEPKLKALQMGPNMIRGTLMYMAPELLRQEAYTTASDVYAFSILMWEVVAWKWYGDETSEMTTPEVKRAVVDGYRQAMPENCSETMAALIRFGWHENKSQRPGMSKIQEELEVEQERLSLKQ